MAHPLPEVLSLLDRMAARPPIDLGLPLEELRAFCDEGVLVHHHLVRDHGPLHAVRDLTVEGVPVRVYVPSDASELPVHVHLHGGGWWMGSIATADPMCRELAHRSGMAVVSVGYRLAPEHRFPAGLDDVCAAVRWVASAPAALGFTPTTISLGGESAGGNLTAAAALRLRDEDGPALVAQWLDIPAVDLTAPDDESMRLYSTGFGLEMAQLELLRAWYADADQVTHPYVSPAHAEDLTGLPPAIVTTAELDPIRDQAERYAQALADAGNEVVTRRWLGHVHATQWLTGMTPGTAEQYEDVVGLLVAHHARASVTA
jgi:acetyl esterase